MRDAGFTKWDVHTPFPVHGMDDAMGIRGTQLPFLVLGGGLTGLGLALADAVVDERGRLPVRHHAASRSSACRRTSRSSSS